MFPQAFEFLFNKRKTSYLSIWPFKGVLIDVRETFSFYANVELRYYCQVQVLQNEATLTLENVFKMHTRVAGLLGLRVSLLLMFCYR